MSIPTVPLTATAQLPVMMTSPAPTMTAYPHAETVVINGALPNSNPTLGGYPLPENRVIHMEQPHATRVLVESPTHIQSMQPHIVSQRIIEAPHFVEPIHVERAPMVVQQPTEIIKEYIGIGEAELKEFENKILGLVERLAKEQQVKIVALEEEMAQMVRMQQIQQLSQPEGSELKEAQYQEMLNREMNKLINMINMLSTSCEDRFGRQDEALLEERKGRQSDIDSWAQGHQARLVQLEDPSRFAEILSATARLEESHQGLTAKFSMLDEKHMGHAQEVAALRLLLEDSRQTVINRQEIQELSMMIGNVKAKTDELAAKTKQAFDKLAEYEVGLQESRLSTKSVIDKWAEFEIGMMDKLGALDEKHKTHIENSANLEQGLSGALNSSHMKLQEELAILKSDHSANHGNIREETNTLRQVLEEVTKQVDLLDGDLKQEQKLRLMVEDRIDQTCNEMKLEIEGSFRESHAALRMELMQLGAAQQGLAGKSAGPDEMKVQAIIKAEIQAVMLTIAEFEKLINMIRGQHEQLLGSHQELSTRTGEILGRFEPMELLRNCEDIKKQHTVFSERLARAETNFNRSMQGSTIGMASNADIEELKTRTLEHAKTLGDLNGVVQEQTKSELSRYNMDLRQLVEVEVRKIGNLDLDEEILARTKNVADLHAKVSKEIAAVRKTIEMYRSELGNAPEIGSLTPKLEESLDKYIHALVARDIQLERETRFTQVSELQTQIQQLKGSPSGKGNWQF